MAFPSSLVFSSSRRTPRRGTGARRTARARSRSRSPARPPRPNRRADLEVRLRVLVRNIRRALCRTPRGEELERSARAPVPGFPREEPRRERPAERAHVEPRPDERGVRVAESLHRRVARLVRRRGRVQASDHRGRRRRDDGGGGGSGIGGGIGIASARGTRRTRRTRARRRRPPLDLLRLGALRERERHATLAAVLNPATGRRTRRKKREGGVVTVVALFRMIVPPRPARAGSVPSARLPHRRNPSTTSTRPREALQNLLPRGPRVDDAHRRLHAHNPHSRRRDGRSIANRAPARPPRRPPRRRAGASPNRGAAVPRAEDAERRAVRRVVPHVGGGGGGRRWSSRDDPRRRRARPPLRQGPERRAHRRGDLLGGDEARARAAAADGHRAAFRAPPGEGRERRGSASCCRAGSRRRGAASRGSRASGRAAGGRRCGQRRRSVAISCEGRWSGGSAKNSSPVAAVGGAAGRVRTRTSSSAEPRRRASRRYDLEGVTNEEEKNERGNERERRTPPGAADWYLSM